MKKHVYIVFCLLIMATSCNDNVIIQENTQPKEVIEDAFLVFSSRHDLKRTIDDLRDGQELGVMPMRSSTSDNYYMLDNANFKSLIETNKENFLASLSDADRSIIENDPEELEYCIPDSIIVDDFFARILNSSRMIQVGDTVYKFIENGVVFTHALTSSALNDITQVENPNIDETEVDDQGRYIVKLNEYVDFMPTTNCELPSIPKDDGKVYGNIILDNGQEIRDVRTIYFYDENDASSLHEFWYGIWGDYVLAINNFDSQYRMVVGLFNVNYANLYAHIGSKVKMQKKVLGIWWNVKAEEIALGWTGVELKFKKPSFSTIPPPDPFASYNNNITNDPEYLMCKFEFNTKEDYLLELPYEIYKECEYVGDVKQNAIDNALSKSNSHLYRMTERFKTGAYATDDKYLYIICNANEIIKINSKTITMKYYQAIVPLFFEAGFVIGNSSFRLEHFLFEPQEVAELGRCCVYGAAKHNGEWLGARIIKQL